METLFLPVVFVLLFFVAVTLFVKWLNNRAKPVSVSELTAKFGLLWNDKKQPYCHACFKKLEPFFYQGAPRHQTFMPLHEIQCIHCNTINNVTENGQKADYFDIVKKV